MPRNASGVYTLPAGNPVVSGTLITDTWANSTLADVAAELTNSLDRYGRGSMLAPFKNADGSLAAPGIAFGNEPATGIARLNTAEMSFITAGALRFKVGLSSVDFSVQVNAAAMIQSAASESFRTTNDSGFVSWYNASGSTRTGYIQGNTANSLRIAAENGSAIQFWTGGAQRASIGSTGAIGLTEQTTITTSGLSAGALRMIDTGGSGVNLFMRGDGGTTPSKTLRVTGGTFQIVNHAYSTVLLGLTDAGALSINAGLSATTGTFSGAVSASVFNGPLTGDVTGNVSGSSGSTTGNAATATALANTRTIWGQNFNGTANVSGALSGATTGTFSGSLTAQSAYIGGASAGGGAVFRVQDPAGNDAGLEFQRLSSVNFGIYSYNRATPAWTNLRLDASGIDFGVSGNITATLSSGGLVFQANKIIQFGTSNVSIIGPDVGGVGNPGMFYDSGDVYYYDRTNDQWIWNIASGTKMILNANGPYDAVQGAYLGWRNLPRNTTAGGVDGQCTAVTAGFTLNTGIAVSTLRTFYNDSASAITVTQGAGVTLRLAGTTTTGNRTLAPRGYATLWVNSTSEYILSGNVT